MGSPRIATRVSFRALAYRPVAHIIAFKAVKPRLFWSVPGCGFAFYLPTDKVMLLLRLWESGNRGAISKAAQLPAFHNPTCDRNPCVLYGRTGGDPAWPVLGDP